MSSVGHGKWITVVFTLAIAGLVGLMVINGVAANLDSGAYDKAVEWCGQHDGELYNARVMWHGGLHCELPNGTDVHMNEVIDPEAKHE